VITELIPGETRKLALRWTLYDGTHDPFLEVDSAQNWEQFRKALSAFDAPGQNVVYADVDGNIGYQATGKIPIRASGDGSLPENGSNNGHEDGYIPFDKLPSTIRPGHHRDRQLPHNAGRISLLDQHRMGGPGVRRGYRAESAEISADMLALQTDIYSRRPLFCGTFVYALDHVRMLLRGPNKLPNCCGMGWPHDRGPAAPSIVSGPRRTGAPAARAQAGRRPRIPNKPRLR
jgi:penicillin amidase